MMLRNLETYLHDHLAGAQFATSLLADLTNQEFDAELAAFAGTLLEEIEKDKQVVEDILSQLDSKRSVLKEASAWIAQKLGRTKLQVNSDPFSIFEALEVLSIGILGKRALWKALEAIASEESSLQSRDYATLATRAAEQHAAVDQRRIAYARSLLADDGDASAS